MRGFDLPFRCLDALADAPVQRLGFQACTFAAAAKLIGAVLGQQDADMHPVSFGLQPVKKALGAIPAVPTPIAFTVDNPATLFLGELAPGFAQRNFATLCIARQVALTFTIAVGLPRFDRTLGKAQGIIWNYQLIIDPHGAAKATTVLAGPHGRIEREMIGLQPSIAYITFGAVKLGREAMTRLSLAMLIDGIDSNKAAAVLERCFDVFG